MQVTCIKAFDADSLEKAVNDYLKKYNVQLRFSFDSFGDNFNITNQKDNWHYLETIDSSLVQIADDKGYLYDRHKVFKLSDDEFFSIDIKSFSNAEFCCQVLLLDKEGNVKNSFVTKTEIYAKTQREEELANVHGMKDWFHDERVIKKANLLLSVYGLEIRLNDNGSFDLYNVKDNKKLACHYNLSINSNVTDESHKESDGRHYCKKNFNVDNLGLVAIDIQEFFDNASLTITFNECQDNEFSIHIKNHEFDSPNYEYVPLDVCHALIDGWTKVLSYLKNNVREEIPKDIQEPLILGAVQSDHSYIYMTLDGVYVLEDKTTKTYRKIEVSSLDEIKSVVCTELDRLFNHKDQAFIEMVRLQINELIEFYKSHPEKIQEKINNFIAASDRKQQEDLAKENTRHLDEEASINRSRFEAAQKVNTIKGKFGIKDCHN